MPLTTPVLQSLEARFTARKTDLTRAFWDELLRPALASVDAAVLEASARLGLTVAEADRVIVRNRALWLFARGFADEWGGALTLDPTWDFDRMRQALCPGERIDAETLDVLAKRAVHGQRRDFVGPSVDAWLDQDTQAILDKHRLPEGDFADARAQFQVRYRQVLFEKLVAEGELRLYPDQLRNDPFFAPGREKKKKKGR